MPTHETTDASDRQIPFDALRAALDRRFRIDTRSLAAIRIALAGILLVDLLHRAPYIELFYTDSGVYPVAAYETTYSQFAGVSLHALSGALWYQQLLFFLAGCVAVAFLLGYRTRLVGVVSLLLLVSLQARNAAVLNGGDRLFRVLFAVALVTPLGERWSIDALRRGSAGASVRSFGTAALLVQPVVVFVSNAILKHRGETWYAGEAIELAMANDAMTILLGNVIVDYPTVLAVLTYGWIVLLAGSPLFLLASVGRFRTAAVFAYGSAFVGMALTMTVGLFPLALTASVLPFLPASFWDGLQHRVPEAWRDRRPDATVLGPLGRPPLERRALASLRTRNGESSVSVLLACCRSLSTALGLLVLVWILLFSAATVGGYDVPEEVDYEHLDQQRWSLYTPDPGEAYNWYVPVAHLPNGSTVHATEGGKPDFDRPPDAAAEYETFRHRKFMQAVRRDSDDELGVTATSYSEWVCREATETQGTSIERITIYRLYQPIPTNGTDGWEEPSKVTMIEYDCSIG